MFCPRRLLQTASWPCLLPWYVPWHVPWLVLWLVRSHCCWLVPWLMPPLVPPLGSSSRALPPPLALLLQLPPPSCTPPSSSLHYTYPLLLPPPTPGVGSLAFPSSSHFCPPLDFSPPPSPLLRPCIPQPLMPPALPSTPPPSLSQHPIIVINCCFSAHPQVICRHRRPYPCDCNCCRRCTYELVDQTLCALVECASSNKALKTNNQQITNALLS